MKVTTVSFSTLCSEKVQDFTNQIKAKTAANTTDKTDPSYISKNTKQNMLYHLKRDRATITLIQHLLEANPEVELSDEDREHLTLITTLSSERSVTKYQFSIGDSIYDKMKEYPKLNLQDMMKKLEKLGLALDFTTGKVVAADDEDVSTEEDVEDITTGKVVAADDEDVSTEEDVEDIIDDEQ